MNKRIYYTGLTLAITGICAVLPTAASAADESIPSQSSIDPQTDQDLLNLQESTHTVSSSRLNLEDSLETADSKQKHQFQEPIIANEAPAALAPEHIARLDIETETSSTEAEDIAEQNISLSTVPKLNTTAQIFSELQSPERKISHSFNNSSSLLALALNKEQKGTTIFEPRESETIENSTQNNKALVAPATTFTTNTQAVSELSSPALQTSKPDDALLSLAPDPTEALIPEIEPLANAVQTTTEQKSNNVTTRSPIAQALPELTPSIVESSIVEPPQTFDNGASLLRPLAPDLPVKSAPANYPNTIQRTSIAEAAAPATPAPKPVEQSNLDTTPITPKSSEILDNYGLVRSIKGNKVSVRHLNGKQKTYSLASAAEARKIRRGGLMGFNTDRRGRITRLAPPEIQKVYQGTLIIVEGTKIGMVTPQGERFITTLSKGKIDRMGLAPGQPIQITQYRGTWATKVCRPGVLSNRQISPEAMQRQRSFLRGETSPTS